ncbi:MAG: carbohydrate-binding domain-containing protein [Clostridia bacterium]|nr:carbohydrate-binding domain-containing protein [Clostridia bacterium]
MKDNKKLIAILAGGLLLLMLCGTALTLTMCGGSGDAATTAVSTLSEHTTDAPPAGNTAATTKGGTSATVGSVVPNDTTDGGIGGDTPVTGTTATDGGNPPATTTKPGGSNTPSTTTKTDGGNTPATTKSEGGNTAPVTTTAANAGTQTPSGDTDASGLTITCISGTKNAYTVSGNTVTFTAVKADSVYSISGKLDGNIVIDVGDSYKFDLEMHGLTLTSDTTSPITVLSGEEVSLTAKNGYQNYVYDNRAAVAEDDAAQYAAAIWSQVDLEICGKGTLTVVSEHNKGIHTKDDLTVKNLTLSVTCTDNALKGNDSVTVESGTTTLIATAGDGIKTDNTDVSDKGNQRGTVEILSGTHNIYAACDGIDAAYNVVIDGDNTVVNIYTDKYSEYSEEVTAVSDSIYYLRYNSQNYKFSVKYTNSDGTFEWVNAEYHSSVRSGRTTYYYYTVDKKSDYQKMTVYAYNSSQSHGQDSNYYSVSSAQSLNDAYDTLALSNRNGSLSVSWTNYTTSSQGGGGMGGGPGGGMQEGNSDKGDYSTKGIKAGNEILIGGGIVTIEAYDDAVHANGGTALDNGSTSTGNVTVSGGTVTVFSNDDGIHADGTLTVSDGTVKVTGSYEGLEGNNVRISGGDVSVISKDDGINAPAASGEAIVISGGKLYIYAGGDGIDSNSRTSYSGIVFSGGKTVVICTSGGNSAIDTEQGYRYTAGQVIAIMPSGGMTSEATHCQNFNSVATRSNLSLTSGRYLNVTVSGSTVASVKMPTSINSAIVIYLGSNSATFASDTSAAGTANADGVYWK